MYMVEDVFLKKLPRKVSVLGKSVYIYGLQTSDLVTTLYHSGPLQILNSLSKTSLFTDSDFKLMVLHLDHLVRPIVTKRM